MTVIDLKRGRTVRPLVSVQLLKTPRSADMAAVVEAQLSASVGAVIVLNKVRARVALDDMQRAINAFNRLGMSTEQCAKALHSFRCAYEGYRK